jgi:hypothetical protein
VEAPTADPLGDSRRQAVLDHEHLRLLALFHYISGGITVAFSLLFGVWLVVMAAMFSFLPAGPHGGDPATPPVHGPPVVFFLAFGGVFLLGVAYGILEIVSGRLISRRKGRVFTLIVAIPRLVLLPYGLILSIFTLIILERPSVKLLYRRSAP